MFDDREQTLKELDMWIGIYERQVDEISPYMNKKLRDVLKKRKHSDKLKTSIFRTRLDCQMYIIMKALRDILKCDMAQRKVDRNGRI
jgi:hypothetical protein